MSSYYIFGAGGHGKVVLDAMLKSGITCAGFVDDSDTLTWVNLPVIKLADIELVEKPSFHVAIGNNSVRATVSQRLSEYDFFSVKHPAAVISDSAKIGQGVLVAANAVVGPDVQLGNHCIINHAAVVDHDCVIGDFSHIAPGACLGGGVKVGKGVLVGAGAVILPGISIADNAIIGAGAVVINDLMAAITVVGNPASPVRKVTR